MKGATMTTDKVVIDGQAIDVINKTLIISNCMFPYTVTIGLDIDSCRSFPCDVNIIDKLYFELMVRRKEEFKRLLTVYYEPLGKAMGWRIDPPVLK